MDKLRENAPSKSATVHEFLSSRGGMAKSKISSAIDEFNTKLVYVLDFLQLINFQRPLLQHISSA